MVVSLTESTVKVSAMVEVSVDIGDAYGVGVLVSTTAVIVSTNSIGACSGCAVVSSADVGATTTMIAANKPRKPRREINLTTLRSSLSKEIKRSLIRYPISANDMVAIYR